MPVTVMTTMISVGGPVQQTLSASNFILRAAGITITRVFLSALRFASAAAPHVDQVGRGAEEQRQPGEEMPGPDLALRQDRR